MSINPKSIYNEFVRANLPAGMTYDSNTNRYVVNNTPWVTYVSAEWYLDYIEKFGYSAGFDPAVLFANNEPGVWYDPSDLSTLFQDTAGTTPVTTPGQTVALMLDKSGNGFHATQPTAAARPTYQTDGTLHWLSFDGVDDWMVTPTITPGIDKAQVFAGVRKLSDAVQMFTETSANAALLNGALFFVFGDSNNAQYSSLGRGTALVTQQQVVKLVGFFAPDTAVLTVTHDIVGDLSTIRRNGVAGANATGDKGTGNFLAYPMYIGSRAGTSLRFNGQLYSLITRFGANLEVAQIESTEAYVAGKTGVTL